MSSGAASDRNTVSPRRTVGAKKLAILAAKLVVTGACFWYIARKIDLSQIWSTIPRLDFRWAALAVVLIMLQIPLVGLRWRNIVDALGSCDWQMTRAAMIAITAIGAFFNQVLPAVAGDGVRSWLLVRSGCDWRNAIASVVIDRVVGVGVLLAMGFAILQLPSRLAALGGYRWLVLGVYGALLLGGIVGLSLTPWLVPTLERSRYSRWIAILASDARRILIGPKGPTVLGLACLVQLLTIAAIWSLGRAQGLMLPATDAAMLYTVMLGVALVPISIGGWGLRELALISILGAHGIAAEQALLFSICFGLTLAVGALPGAVVWLLYSVPPALRSAERSS